jgi:hypothetical protein
MKNKSARNKKGKYVQLGFDFSSTGSIVLVGGHDGCREDHNPSESCPGCNARLRRKGGCWACDRCGYRECSG